MEEKTFKENISFLSKYLSFNLSTEYASMYWNMLKHLPDEQFKLSCTNIIKDFIPTATVPFPLVVHFLRYCGESGDNQAIASISKLKKAIRQVGQYGSITFNDSAMHYAINSFGGWESICTWTDTEWDVNEKRLLETYKMAINNRYEDDYHLQGICEKNNGIYTVYSVKQNGKITMLRKENPMLPKQENSSKLTSGTNNAIVSIGESLNDAFPLL